MKHITITKLISGALLVLGLLVGTSQAHAQTATTTDMGSTTLPMVTSISAASSADGTSETISWLSNTNTNSQVAYGLNSNYSASTTLNSTLTMNHNVLIQGLTPSTTYHFQVISSDASNNMATSADQVFMTNVATSTNTGGTGTSTTISDLQNQVTILQGDINSLQARLNTIWAELSALLNGNTGGNTGGTGNTAAASLTPSTVTVSAGSNSVVDFNGRNFGHEETVTISRDGVQVGSVHADGGGNFSTGSMSLPTTAGTYTYTFAGATSGTSLTSTVTVQ